MFTQTITLPFYAIVFILVAGAIAGYVIRAGQRMKMRNLIEDLDRERHSVNARILELEKETLDLENRLRERQSPVIPIKKPATPVSEESSSKITSADLSLRKQLLGKDDKNRHSASR